MQVSCFNKNMEPYKSLLEEYGEEIMYYIGNLMGTNTFKKWKGDDELPIYSEGKLYSNDNKVWNIADEINSVKNTNFNQLVNEILISKLQSFVNELGVNVEVVNDIKTLTGYDAEATTDLLYKTILIKSSSNLEENLIRESAYVALSFLGKKSKIRTSLINSIENMRGYEQELLKYKNSKLNEYKIKELITIDFLANAIKENFNKEEQDIELKNSYWQIQGTYPLEKRIKYIISKIIRAIKRLLNMDKLSQSELDTLFNGLANHILNKNTSIFGEQLSPKMQLVNYNDTIKNDPQAEKIINDFADLGILLTGSLALRKLGTLYRTPNESLHDLDFTVPEELTKDSLELLEEKKQKELTEILKTIPINYPDRQLIIDSIASKYTRNADNILYNSNLYKSIKELYPSLKKVRSFYNKGVYTWSGKIFDKYDIDLFMGKSPFNPKVTQDVQDWQSIFKAKLQMGRAKDIRDFIHFKPYSIEPTQKSQESGYRHFTFKPITNEAPSEHLEIDISVLDNTGIEYDYELEKYKQGDRIIPNRISNRGEEFTNKFFRRSAKREQDYIAANKGTVYHDWMEFILGKLIQGKGFTQKDVILFTKQRHKDWKYDDNFYKFVSISIDRLGNKYHKDYYEDIVKSAKQLLDRIKSKGDVQEIRLEQIVYNKEKDEAGRLDILVIYKDGSVAVLDYKSQFMPIEFQPGGNFKFKDEYGEYERIAPYKEMKYRILAEGYEEALNSMGFNKIKYFEILPVLVNLDREGNLKHFASTRFDTNTPLDAMYSGAFKISTLAEDHPINKELGRVRERIKELSSDKNTKSNPIAVLELNKLLKAEKSIIEGTDYSAGFKLIYDAIRNISNSIKDKEMNKEFIDGLLVEYNKLNNYANAVIIGSRIADELLEINKNKGTELHKLLREIKYGVDVLQDRIKGIIIKYIGDTTGIDISEYDVDSNRFLDSFTLSSRLDIKEVQALRQLYINAVSLQREALLEFEKELDTKLKAVETKIGLKKAYDLLINKDRYTLIRKYSDKHYEEDKEARRNKNFIFLKSKYKIDKKKYNEFVEKQRAYITEKMNKAIGLSEEEKINQITRFMNSFSDDAAYLHPYAYRYLEFRNNESDYYSDEFKKIAEYPELLDFYKFYRETIYEISKKLGIELKHNFVPTITNNIMENYLDYGKIDSKGQWQNFLNAITVNQFDYESNNDLYIPILYMNPVMTEKIKAQKEAEIKELDSLGLNKTEKKKLRQKIEAKYAGYAGTKSLDLGRSLLQLYSMASDYYEKNNIKDLVLFMDDFIKHKQVYETTSLGKKIKNYIGDKLGVPTSNPAIFNSVMRKLIFGQNIQDKKKSFMIGNYEISTYRVIQELMKLQSIAQLAFNDVSALAGAVNAGVNTWLMGVKNRFYTRKQLAKARNEAIRNPRTFYALYEYFLESDYQKARKKSYSKLISGVTLDKLYALQRKPQAFYKTLQLLAMMDNYVIDSHGMPIRKNKGVDVTGLKTVREALDITEEGIQWKDVPDAWKNRGIMQFLLTVENVATQTTGEISKYDMNVVTTSIFGRMIMMYRSWIAPTVSERFGKPKEVKEIGEIEVGRYLVMLGFIRGTVLEKLQRITQLGLEIGGVSRIANIFGVKRAQDSDNNLEASQYYYDKYLQDNPNTKISFQEFHTMRQQELRTAILEFRVMLLALTLYSLLLQGDWDDDDEEDYKEIPFGKKLNEYTKRVITELSFYSNPFETFKILDSPIAGYSTLQDGFGIITNLMDEFRDITLGENQEKDSRGFLYHTKNFIPLGRPFTKLIDEILYEGKNYVPEESSRTLDFF